MRKGNFATIAVLLALAAYLYHRYQQYTCKKGNFMDTKGQCPDAACSFLDFLFKNCNGVQDGY